MPLSTEHQATCKYSKTKVTCDLPQDCNARVPSWKNEKPFDVCKEIPIAREFPE